MHSLRTRFALLTVWMIVIAVGVVTFVSVLFIQRNERHDSDQLLLLLCETGERNLDYYFNSVQNSVRKVATFVEDDLDGLEDKQLESHMERVRKYFEELAYRTNGVLTYYYRIDPEISKSVKGFWYTNTTGEGFEEHEVTDITLYDTKDTSRLVWFTVPKHSGKPIWLSPYITDNLDMRVISYNVPIYWRGRFVGVVGIEIDYSEMAKQVESIRLYKSGYAFLNDEEGNIIYHPRIDVAQLSPEQLPRVPDGMVTGSTFYRYTFEGVEKRAAWLELCNGMHLNVAVPVSETDGNWQSLVREILAISAVVLLTLSIFTLFYTQKITRPLEELTAAAEQIDAGNYEFTLDYDGDDEVGRLTSTFKTLASHMNDHIQDLNTRVYIDALTSVKNKGAFTAAVEQLQQRIVDPEQHPEFAVAVFDCDDLKSINDQFGHDKGDAYLKCACRMICRTFQHSPVYRIGGDEFAVILQNGDYELRDELASNFNRAVEETAASDANKWEKPSVAMGVAVYTPGVDATAIDVVRRADKTMYVNKRIRKTAQKLAMR